MKILVAGAGAGKTSKMANKVIDRFKEVKDGKIIYVITYTNAARDQIREKIIEIHGFIPKQIKVETSHVFLLREIIFPFHHLLFKTHYSEVSHIELPNNYAYKNKKIKELNDNNIIHVEKVSEVSKWIIDKKSTDTKIIKTRREKIITVINKYLDSVFIDEAQDIDRHFLEVIQRLDKSGVDLFLVGDPKQDLRGRNAFRELIDKYKKHVTYKQENHRCPVFHVKLANLYVPEEEKQIEQTSKKGELEFVLESQINPWKFIENNKWDYVFINKKNDRYSTHSNDLHQKENNLFYELKVLVKKSEVREQDIDRIAYVLLKIILERLIKKTKWQIVNNLQNSLNIKLSKQDKARLLEQLDHLKDYKTSDEGILVQSIDKVKGLEGDQVLFILTSDLAPYLFKENKERNKMLNYLYVALTRAREKLAILVSEEVEDRYGREVVLEKINGLKEMIEI